MPELPEIEVLSRDLRREAGGKKIAEFISRQPQSLNLPVAELKEKVAGQRIADVRRRGKSVVIELERGDLWVNLGIAGHMLSDRKFHPDGGTTVIGFEDGSSLYIDKAFMGHTHYLTRDESKARWDEFGVDPFDTAMGIGTFSDMTTAAGNLPIKVLLMDQSKIAGLGSVYADEILNRTGINPARKSESVPSKEAGILLDNLKRVMVQSILDRGFRGDWVNLNDTPGHYILYVHGQEKCGNCGTEVKKVSINGNTTYYCPKEQPEP